MPEVSIDELLAGLDDVLAPDAAFDARLRRRLEIELASPTTAIRDDGETPLEVVELELTGARNDPTTTRRWWLAAVAAALIGAVIVVIALVRDTDGGTAPVVDDPGVSVPGAERSFADAALDSATIDDGANPYWVAAGRDLWVVSLEGELTRLDPSSLAPTGTLPLPESSAIAAGADAVWVADVLTGSVLRIDPTELQVATTIPTGIAIEPDTRRPLGVPFASGTPEDYARIGGIDATDAAVWVGDHDGRLVLIDPETETVSREIAIDLRPDIVRATEASLLVGDLGSDAVVVLDATTGDELVRFDAIESLVGADLVGGVAYVVDGSEGVVTRIDVATGSTTLSDPLGASTSAAGLPIYDAGVVASGAGVVVETDDGLFVLDPVTLALDGELDITGTGGEMTIGPDGSAYVVRYSSRTITRVTPS